MEDPGLVLAGESSFTSIPAGFCVSAPTECTGTSSECAVLAAAGREFDLSVMAVAWQAAGEADAEFCAGNPLTENFRFAGLELSHELVAPSNGSAGAIGQRQISFLAQDAGRVNLSQSLSEVGVFRIGVAGGQTYLGRTLPAALSAPLGRIVPDYFQIESADSEAGVLSPGCSIAGDFSYLGEPISWAVTPETQISARNADGGLTLNYTEGGFLKLSPDGISRSFGTTDVGSSAGPASEAVGVDYLAPQEMSYRTVAPGVMGFGFPQSDGEAGTDQFVHAKTIQRLAPFAPALTYSIDEVRDSDDVTAKGSQAFYPEAPFAIRYGRLTMENVYGPETASALEMPFRAEYWSGSRFVTHADDGCTLWASSDVTAHPETTAINYSLPAADGALVAGASVLRLVPNGETGTDILRWGVPVWLQDDWNQAGELAAPSAQATFGVYRGHDRIIYWREVVGD